MLATTLEEATRVSKNESDFKHRTLEESEIRLLKIRQGCEFDEVRCTISHFNIEALPPYYAVSYRWGTSEDAISISIDGKSFEVMSNAWFALHYLRKHYVGKCIWLDAICIDQSNIEERNAQVQLMSDIFSKAEEVVLWLGLEDEHTATAFDALRSMVRWNQIKPTASELRNLKIALGPIKYSNRDKSISDHVRSFSDALYPGTVLHHWGFILDQIASVDETLRSRKRWDDLNAASDLYESLDQALAPFRRWRECMPSPYQFERFHKALERLFQRDIWSRIWIVQEILSASKITLVCGEQRATWGFVDLLVAQHVHDDLEFFPTSITAPIRNVVEDRRRFGAQAPIPRLLDFLSNYRDCDCLDTRDKIYGLVALHNRHASSSFKVDYARSVESLLMYAFAFSSEDLSSSEQDIVAVFNKLWKLLLMHENAERFQSWLRPRLMFTASCKILECFLESGEIVEIPCITHFVRKGFVIGPLRDPSPSDTSAQKLESPATSWRYNNLPFLFAAWTRNNREIMLNILQKAPSRLRNDVHATRLSLRAAIGRTDRLLEDALYTTDHSAKVVCASSGYVGMVCHEAQEGDIVYTIPRYIHNDDTLFSDFVVRPGATGYSLVGPAFVDRTIDGLLEHETPSIVPNGRIWFAVGPNIFGFSPEIDGYRGPDAEQDGSSNIEITIEL